MRVRNQRMTKRPRVAFAEASLLECAFDLVSELAQRSPPSRFGTLAPLPRPGLRSRCLRQLLRDSAQNRVATPCTRPLRPGGLPGLRPPRLGPCCDSGGELYQPRKRQKAARWAAWSLAWLRGLDLNQRPLGYEPNELPDCSTPRRSGVQSIWSVPGAVKERRTARRDARFCIAEADVVVSGRRRGRPT